MDYKKTPEYILGVLQDLITDAYVFSIMEVNSLIKEKVGSKGIGLNVEYGDRYCRIQLNNIFFDVFYYKDIYYIINPNTIGIRYDLNDVANFINSELNGSILLEGIRKDFRKIEKNCYLTDFLKRVSLEERFQNYLRHFSIGRNELIYSTPDQHFIINYNGGYNYTSSSNNLFHHNENLIDFIENFWKAIDKHYLNY